MTDAAFARAEAQYIEPPAEPKTYSRQEIAEKRRLIEEHIREWADDNIIEIEESSDVRHVINEAEKLLKYLIDQEYELTYMESREDVERWFS